MEGQPHSLEDSRYQGYTVWWGARSQGLDISPVCIPYSDVLWLGVFDVDWEAGLLVTSAPWPGCK